MQLKRLSDILSRLIDVTMVNTTELNDFTEGSVIRSIYEAVAMELEQYYMLSRENIFWGIQHGVLDTFGFAKREAKYATGLVRVDFYAPLALNIVIPKGTLFASSDTANYPQTFITEDAWHVQAGSQSALIEVHCTQTGTIGNIPTGVISTVQTDRQEISAVTNPEDFLSGSDEESIEDVRGRFRAYVETTGRATTKSVAYAARQVPEITGAYVDEHVGWIHVFCHDANGDLPASLQAKVEAAIQDYRPVGMKWSVEPVVKQTADISVGITLRDMSQSTLAFDAGVKRVIRDYINSLNVAEDVVLSDIVMAVRKINEGLIYDVKVTNQTSNLKAASNGIFRAGDLEVADYPMAMVIPEEGNFDYDTDIANDLEYGSQLNTDDMTVGDAYEDMTDTQYGGDSSSDSDATNGTV